MIEVRDYELSLWTLQDSFLTVLKPFGTGVKGQVQEGKLSIKDDGNETLSFSIPMYLYQKNGSITTKKENPIWCNVINGTLIADLRKVKLIFDKHGTNEKIFEFVILKVTERHETDQLFCDVECEGLAFHELGKIGYKLVLNSDEFELDHKNWEESDKSAAEPVATIQYWNDKIFANRKDWTYEVVMDQHEEIGREDLTTNKIYEDRYVASWEVVNDQIQPTRWEIGKEKARTTFEIKESNIFNATQEIAEAFGVFCRYEYQYDNTYHITGRKVVYYNNFLNEEVGAIDLTYPYNTNQITREMDSTDLITKMYIQTVDDNLTDEGTVSITSVEANKTGEDYLLNFDYLYKIGSISEEQYADIAKFEVEIRKLNDQFEKYSSIYTNRSKQLESIEAEIQHIKDCITEDREEIANVDEQIRAFGLSDGDNDAKTVTIKMPNSNAQRDTFKSKKKSSTYAVSLPAEFSKGIAKDNDIKAYATCDSSSYALSNRITSIKVWRNEKTGEVKEIYNIPKKMKLSGSNTTTEIKTVYLTYKCNPSLQYSEIKQNYTNKLNKDTTRLNKLQKRKVKIQQIYDNANTKIQTISEQKKKLIVEFEEMMGPALREGYWNPENYNEYGNRYSGTISLKRTTNNRHNNRDLGIRADNIPITDTGTYLNFIWDNGKDSNGEEISTWEEEQKSYYESGVNQDKIYYPCIRISAQVLKELNKVFNPAPNSTDTDYEYWQKYKHKNFDDLEMYSLMFYIGTETENQQVLNDVDGWVSLAIGSECQFAFRKGFLKGDQTKPYIFPVFVLTGLDQFDDDTANAILSVPCKLARVVTWIKSTDPDVEEPEQTMLDTEDIVLNDDLEMYWWIDSEADDSDSWNNGSRYLVKKTSAGYVARKDYYPIKAYDLYYPRIIVKSWKLKKSQDGELADLTIKCGNAIEGIAASGVNLKDYEDFSIIATTSEMQNDEDFVPELWEAITIKPEALLKYGCAESNSSIFAPYPVFSIDYSISNADTAIYLDAIQVMKENSQPKVSYNVSLNNTRKELIENAYNLLGIIAHINDTDLKFKNIQGYVSEIEMNLDHPWEDSITIQNYKNKFEDLFSKIVAETAAMQKNAYTVGFAANALTTSGGITPEVMQYTLVNTNLNYAFNNGKLTIDEVNGIVGESEAGVVAYRGGGIFTASEKDENGNWAWNTGILPTGINANIITAGRLDTNQVNIYAGSDLRFMWNGEGLFAYKWNTLAADLAVTNGTAIPDDYVPKIDSKQYVKYNGEGLHLVAEPGTQYIAPTWKDEELKFYLSIKPTRCRCINNQIIMVDYNDEEQIQTTGVVVGTYSLYSGYTYDDIVDWNDGVFFNEDEEPIGTYNFTLSNPIDINNILYYQTTPVGEYSYDQINNKYVINYICSAISSEKYYNLIIPDECFEDFTFGTQNNHSNKTINEDGYNYKIRYNNSCGGEIWNYIDFLFDENGKQIQISITLSQNNKYTIQSYTGIDLVKRVEVSWDGFLLRNWENEVVFHADPTSGNLYAQFESIFLRNSAFPIAPKLIPERYIGFKYSNYNQVAIPTLDGHNAIIDLGSFTEDKSGNTAEYWLRINSFPFNPTDDFNGNGEIQYRSIHQINGISNIVEIETNADNGFHVATTGESSIQATQVTLSAVPIRGDDVNFEFLNTAAAYLFLEQGRITLETRNDEGQDGAHAVITTNTFGLYTANSTATITTSADGNLFLTSANTKNNYQSGNSSATTTGNIRLYASASTGTILLRASQIKFRVGSYCVRMNISSGGTVSWTTVTNS